jgi:hypothetical protein
MMSRLPAGTRVRLRSFVVASMAHNHRRLPIDWVQSTRRGGIVHIFGCENNLGWEAEQRSMAEAGSREGCSMMWPDSHVVNLLTMPRCLSAQSKFTRLGFANGRLPLPSLEENRKHLVAIVN